MKLSVNASDGSVVELSFDKGPVYIGRQIGSEVFLPDLYVSRQHAVIFATKKGQWFVEDLDSANKTFLNSTAVHKSVIKDGDQITIGGFDIDIHLTGDIKTQDFQQPKKPVHMEETMIADHNTDDD